MSSLNYCSEALNRNERHHQQQTLFLMSEVTVRHLDAIVVDQTHLRVHPPLGMPVGANVKLAILANATPPVRAPQRVPRKAKSVLAHYLRHPVKLPAFTPLTREEANVRV